MAAKRLHIKTYGCQMNAYDSARMADVLAPLGYETVDAPDHADLVILNTCHIREKAAEKVYSEIGRLRQTRDNRRAQGGDMMIAVGGCVAQAQGKQMMRRAPEIDLIFGPQSYQALPGLIARAEAQRLAGEAASVVAMDFAPRDKFDQLPEERAPQGVTAFLTIQEGCDKFCTFCVVPYTRGAEYSRPVRSIEEEATRLAASGAAEITLLGQNVNAYCGDDGAGGHVGLGALMRRLARIDGLERIRYTTSHPRDVDDDLIAAHREVPQIMPYLHLPVQSGSDRILAAMNRQHSADTYYRTVDRLRAARPDLALSSDFIVGFPGETAADFAATMKLVRDIGFAQAYSFKYSARPGTPAADVADQVPEDVKSERLALLQDALNAQQRRFNENCVGQTLPVLFEKPGRHKGQVMGRSPYMQAVTVSAGHDAVVGSIRPVRIAACLPNSLSGELADAPVAAVAP